MKSNFFTSRRAFLLLKQSTPALALAFSMAASTALAETDVQMLYRNYDDSRTTVTSPSLDVSSTFNNDQQKVSAGFAQDVVTSSSADVTTFSSRGIIHEERHEFSGGMETAVPDGTMSIGYVQSDEHDYHSKIVSAGGTREFFTKNTVVGFGFASGDDTINSSSNSLFDERMRNQVYSLSLTQVLSKISLLQLLYDFRVENGYLASPYRKAKFDDGNGNITARDENHPRTRNRNAWAVKYNYYFDKYGISNANTYRLYQDSWGIMSHTLETRFTKDFGTKWSVGVALRYYMQNKAKFYDEYYEGSSPAFYTGNKTLATYHSYLLSVRPAYNVTDHWTLYLKAETYQQSFNDAVDAYSLGTKSDDKPLEISAFVVGLGISAKF
jgi:Protein of unknown function (DUF3570)